MEFEVNICGTRAIRVSKIVVEILRVFYNELCKLSNDFDKVIMHIVLIECLTRNIGCLFDAMSKNMVEGSDRMKCMQVNGILIDKEVKLIVTHNGKEYLFIFMPYSIFEGYNLDLINPEVIEKCNTVVVYTSTGNNSIEVYYIKTLISLFYFAYRIEVEEKRKKLNNRKVSRI